MYKILAFVLFSSFVFASEGLAQSKPPKEINLENFIFLETKYGRTIIQLYPKKAPKHVERVRKLVREGFYDGLKFHRVIHGFMAQTGDPQGTGVGGSKYGNLRAEFNDVPFNRGVIGAARTQDPHTANSQFFICFQAARFLDGKYTVWGKVVRGMENIDKIKRGVGRSGTVDDPDTIVSMKVVADTKDPPIALLKQFVPGFESNPAGHRLPRL